MQVTTALHTCMGILCNILLIQMSRERDSCTDTADALDNTAKWLAVTGSVGVVVTLIGTVLGMSTITRAITHVNNCTTSETLLPSTTTRSLKQHSLLIGKCKHALMYAGWFLTLFLHAWILLAGNFWILNFTHWTCSMHVVACIYILLWDGAFLVSLVAGKSW